MILKAICAGIVGFGSGTETREHGDVILLHDEMTSLCTFGGIANMCHTSYSFTCVISFILACSGCVGAWSVCAVAEYNRGPGNAVRRRRGGGNTGTQTQALS